MLLLTLLKLKSQDFVRVTVKFDVSKPLRRSKSFNLPSGESTVVFYDYEKVQKDALNAKGSLMKKTHVLC